MFHFLYYMLCFSGDLTNLHCILPGHYSVLLNICFSLSISACLSEFLLKPTNANSKYKKSSDYPEQLRCLFKYYIAFHGEKNHKLHVMGFLRIFCTGKGTEITFNDQTSNYRNQRYIGFQFPGQRVKIKNILFSIMTLFIN